MTRFARLLICLAAIGLAAAQPVSPRPESSRGALGPARRFVLAEDFDSIGGLTVNGWILRNNSQPGNNLVPSWFRGGDNPAWFTEPRWSPSFPAMAEGAHYLAANFRTAGGSNNNAAGTISLWAVTPPLALRDCTQVSFWIRSAGGAPDGLQVLFAFGEHADPGTTPDDIGDFLTVLEIINGDWSKDGFPTDWTKIDLTLNLAAPAIGRFAFRYVVPDGGPAGSRSDFIGLSTLRISTRWLGEM